jgi:hypothetical protein
VIDRLGAYNSVILVQSALGSPASRRLRLLASRLLGRGAGRILVFFHADAASLADDDERLAWMELGSHPQLDLAVCQAARARRVVTALEAPFQAASLVRFWDAVLGAETLYAPGRCRLGPGGFLVRIARAVGEPEGGEYLEMVLAGASLELDLVVLFEADGLALLTGDRARPWRQLTDHGLARMVTTSAGPVSTRLEVVDESQIEKWREARHWIEP